MERGLQWDIQSNLIVANLKRSEKNLFPMSVDWKVFSFVKIYKIHNKYLI